MHRATLLDFPDRRSAYRFVSELRRLYELDRWAALRVQPRGNDVLVEVPAQQWSNDVADVAERNGGRELPAEEAETRWPSPGARGSKPAHRPSAPER